METPLSPFTPPSKIHPAEEILLKYRFWIMAALAVSLVVGIYLMITPPTNLLAQDSVAISDENQPSNEDTTAPTTGQIIVDIAGGVVNPGVYFLPTGSIVEDGIKASGGFSRQADLNAIARTINRAGLVDSHSKIYIPKHGDSVATVLSSTTSASTATPTPSIGSKININTATGSELDVLPGVGPVTAQRIIDYRLQNGDFQSIEEIKNVPGLGEAKFDQLKDLITI